MARERTRLMTRLKIGTRRAGLRKYAEWSRIDLICKQSRWWVDKHGTLRDISKIDADYQRALLRYFRANANRLMFCFVFSDIRPYGYPDGGADLYQDVTSPAEWIEKQPLVRALAALVEPA